MDDNMNMEEDMDVNDSKIDRYIFDFCLPTDRTNWLYRFDALRPNHWMDIEELVDMPAFIRETIMKCMAFITTVLWPAINRHRKNGMLHLLLAQANKLVDHILLFCSSLFIEAYLLWLDLSDLIYFDPSTRVHRFEPVKNSTI